MSKKKVFVVSILLEGGALSLGGLLKAPVSYLFADNCRASIFANRNQSLLNSHRPILKQHFIIY